jgi:hypothetical protein
MNCKYNGLGYAYEDNCNKLNSENCGYYKYFQFLDNRAIKINRGK